jgi:hypothetical protein
MHGTEQPLTTAITGKHSPGSICAMRTRRQTQHNNACALVTKTRNWFAPILVVSVCGALLNCNCATPFDQPWALLALGYLGSYLL